MVSVTRKDGTFVSTAEVLAWLDERSWSHDPAEWTPEQDRETRLSWGICGHRTRWRGERTPCVKKPERGTGRCRNAGGKSKQGAAAPNVTTLAHSRYVPPPLMAVVAKALADGDLLSAHRDLALIEGRMDQLLRRLDTAETGRTWHALREEWDGLNRALQATRRNPGDEQAAARAAELMVSINLLIGRGQGDAQAWSELGDVLELRRKFIETESKRREKAKEQVSIEEAMLAYRALVLAVKKVVKDPRQQEDLAEEFARIAGVAAIPRLRETASGVT